MEGKEPLAEEREKSELFTQRVYVLALSMDWQVLCVNLTQARAEEMPQ